MDAFTSASWTSQRARATAVRNRSAPIVMPRQMAGHMPDPRVPANDWSHRPDIGQSTDRAARAGTFIRAIAILGTVALTAGVALVLYGPAIAAVWSL